MKSADSHSTGIESLGIWARIDPALLDDFSSDWPAPDARDARLVQKIRNRVLTQVGSKTLPKQKPATHKISQFALLAAAVVLVSGLAWIFYQFMPFNEASPTITAASTYRPTQATQSTTRQNTTTQSTSAQNTTASPTLTNGIFVPVYQIPEDPKAIEDMIGVVVIKKKIYIQSQTTIEYERARLLQGDYIGKGKRNLDEWSTQADLTTELASNTDFAFYTVKGYDPDFRVMGFFVSADQVSRCMIYDCLNGIYVARGYDVFGKLNLQNFDKQSYSGQEVPIVESFVEALSETTPVQQVDPGIDMSEQSGNRRELYLTLQDGCRVRITMIKGGFMHYGPAAVWFEMMDKELFDAVWRQFASPDV